MIRPESKFDLYFENNFEIPIKQFYYLIKEKQIFLNDNENEDFFTIDQLNDYMEKKIYDEIKSFFRKVFEELLNENFLKNKYKCQYCNKSYKEDNQHLFFSSNNYFHENCYKLAKRTQSFNFGELKIDEEYYKLYTNCKSNIINKTSEIIQKNEIENFFTFIEENLRTKNNISELEREFIKDELERFKKKIFKNIFDNKERKNKIIEEEYNKYNELILDKEKFEKKSKEWMEKWKTKINNYFHSNTNSIFNWVILKSCESIKNNNQTNDCDIYLEYEVKNKINKKLVINLYKFMLYKNSNLLYLTEPVELEKKDKIENNFNFDNKGFYIYKNNDKYKIYTTEKNFIEFSGLYDYDIYSKTLVVYKNEDNLRKVSIYNSKAHQSLKVLKNLNINAINNEQSNIHKIMLIPCESGYINQSVLFFVDDEIFCIKIKDNNLFPNKIKLSEYFDINNNFNFKDFQFIIYFDFLLILKYKNDTHEWIGKLFSLYIEDKSILEEIKVDNDIKLTGIEQNAKFSLAKIKNDKKYLIAINITNGAPKIVYWEIFSQISGILTNYITTGVVDNKIKISLGNCVVNYFYHCFLKYPIVGAIEYNYNKYEEKKRINLKIFFEEQNSNNNDIEIFRDYINKLKSICQAKKKFTDINEIINVKIEKYKKSNKKDTNLSEILIKFLELIPIQLAKIMYREFDIMSNGESIKKRLLKEINKREDLKKEEEIDSDSYPNMIDFYMKESIFNYFELPVIVICCFGTQSIGKSTFLNELTGSLFDVSGMRCTEGIWMTVKLFIHSKKGNEKKCNHICQICEENSCYLFSHKKDIKCICENCICGKNCSFNHENNENNENNKSTNFINCDLKCSLEKGHEEQLKCIFENCECNCKCQCICKTKNHEHICQNCKFKDNCTCECNCKHLCRYPALLHNFICVCLDFEGLGTFERSNEQDIQMALIGSAMGNSIIFRTNNTYDKFTEETLDNISKGSQRIDNTKIKNLFGGSLVFSPRDVNESNKRQLRDEFQSKIKKSLKKWTENNNKIHNYHIFGLFDDYLFSPTPSYFDQGYYDTLRDKLVIDFIGNPLRYRTHPIYETGKDFYGNLKVFLASIYIGDFDFLSNRKEKIVKNYINSNKMKAYGVIGEYDEDQEINDLFSDFNGLKIYFNKNYLSKLEIDFKHNKKFEASNTLVINNLENFDNIQQGNYTLEEYNMNINIAKKEDNSFSMTISNFEDYGLILLIHEKYENRISYDNICEDFFKLWSSINEKILFTEKSKIIINFKLFIKSIVQRRYDNVKKWLEKITAKYENLKEIGNLDPSLNIKWNMCSVNCNSCKYLCYKRFDHQNEHDCHYDHKCEKNCTYCTDANELHKCKVPNCEQKKCSMVSGHEGIHKCEHQHNCDGICECFSFTTNCEKNCVLPYPHEGKHKCKEENHQCNGTCSYNGLARGCSKNCKLGYHDSSKPHNCKETHKCPKYCDCKGRARVNLNEGEEEFCEELFGHQGEHHNCGKRHFCNETCIKNCKNKCIKTYDHGNDHDCGETKHLCNKPCPFLSQSKNCEKTCIRDFGHSGDCICKLNTSDSHICNKKCSVPNCNNECVLKIGHEEGKCACGTCNCQVICHFRNCGQTCKFKAGHEFKEGESRIHICSALKHYCNEDCIYKNNSRCCLEKCKIILEIDPNHNRHDCLAVHRCRETCLIFGCSINCRRDCFREVNESGQHKNNESKHLCEIKDDHKCSKQCHLYNYTRNCYIECKEKITENNFDQNLRTHIGEHICGSPSHLCRLECKKYKLENNQIVICNKICSLNHDHQNRNEDCNCGDTSHICHINCQYASCSRGCEKFCVTPLNQPHQIHNCRLSKEDHLCNEKCPYCDERCYLSYQHRGNCRFATIHYCTEPCMASDGKCRGKCAKAKGHSNEHLCGLPKNMHSCLEKCELCNEKCGHAFGHIKKNHIICNKCGNKDCILVENFFFSSGHHLCGAEHDCKGKCEIPGFCLISSVTKKKDVYNKNSKCISYDVYETQIRKKELPCKIKIPVYRTKHDGIHKCSEGNEGDKHKCGFECQQCGNFCILDHNHQEPLHFCTHGNIKNSRVYVSDSTEAQLKKNNIVYSFQNDENVEVFLCDEYCREQDQGHTHLLTEIPFFDSKYVRELNKNNGNFYECKCSYFWKEFLKFKGNIDEEKSSKCNHYCGGNHENEKINIKKGEKVYCQLPLWHETEEHVYKCSHSNGFYTIFLVDQSGSMSSSAAKPNRKDLKHDNVLGAVIEAILSYCQTRAENNPREKCALIGYSDKAKIIFDDIEIKEVDTIKEKCINNLTPNGNTYFKFAFEEAKTIVDQLKNRDYIPIIILLTDGIDFEPNDTINYVKDDVSYIFLYFQYS